MDPLLAFTVLAAAGVAGSLTFAVWRAVARPAEGQNFEEAIEAVTTGSEISTPQVALSKSRKERNRPATWNNWWLEGAEKAGREPADPSSFGRAMLGVVIVSLMFGLLVYPTGPAAVVAPIAAVVAVRAWLALEQAKRRAALDKQLPTLLSGLRSQIHSGQTVQAALMKVSEDMPAPLGDELRIVRDQINVSVPVEAALQQMANRVNSRLVQFLVSSIGIAIRSGSDLVPQLGTIEQIVRQRARIAGKIRSAVALAKPTSYIALAAPPLMFVWMMFTTEGYLAYWLGEGLITGLIGVALYVVGAFTVRVMVTNVEKI